MRDPFATHFRIIIGSVLDEYHISCTEKLKVGKKRAREKESHLPWGLGLGALPEQGNALQNNSEL